MRMPVLAGSPEYQHSVAALHNITLTIEIGRYLLGSQRWYNSRASNLCCAGRSPGKVPTSALHSSIFLSEQQHVAPHSPDLRRAETSAAEPAAPMPGGAAWRGRLLVLVNSLPKDSSVQYTVHIQTQSVASRGWGGVRAARTLPAEKGRAVVIERHIVGDRLALWYAQKLDCSAQ